MFPAIRLPKGRDWTWIIAPFDMAKTVIFSRFLLSTERPLPVPTPLSGDETNATEVPADSSTP
jgi:hypothetical protein